MATLSASMIHDHAMRYRRIDPFHEWRVPELQMLLSYANARIEELEYDRAYYIAMIECLMESGGTVEISRMMDKGF